MTYSMFKFMCILSRHTQILSSSFHFKFQSISLARFGAWTTVNVDFPHFKRFSCLLSFMQTYCRCQATHISCSIAEHSFFSILLLQIEVWKLLQNCQISPAFSSSPEVYIFHCFGRFLFRNYFYRVLIIRLAFQNSFLQYFLFKDNLIIYRSSRDYI